MTSGAAMRAKRHLEAKELFARGDYSGSRELLERVRERWGDHVGILCDIASCRYRAGEFSKWRFAVQAACSAFDEVAERLSPESRIRTIFLLAKHLEEAGQIAPSLRLYAWGRDEVSRTPALCAWRSLFQCQIFRVRSMLRVREGLGTAYAELLEIQASEVDAHEFIELQHGLILAEAELLGPVQACARLKSYLAIPELGETMRNLAVFDLLELHLLEGWQLDSALRECALGLTPSSDFESALQSLAKGEAPRGDRMPLAGHLRILQIKLTRAVDAGLAAEIRDRIALLIESLDAESAKIWCGRLPKGTAYLLVLKADVRALTVECRGRMLDLRRSTNAFRLLEALADGTPRALEEITQVLWKARYNPSYYHRIRMLVKRTNLRLLTVSGEGTVIELREQNLQLNPAVRVLIN